MYWIITDSTIDMNKSFVDAQKNFKVVSLSYIIDGQNYIPDGTDEHTRGVYDKLREGKMITTSQVNSETWKESFEPVLEDGHDVLCIAFSSGLSGTCQAAAVAAAELREKYPQRRIEVIDSLAASAGEGLLVHYALRNRDKGMSFDDNVAWIRSNVQNLVHWFTVNDLMHLMRGGRVSAVSAYVGTLVKIKPVMHVNEEGKLIPREKVMGRRKSLRALVDKIKEKIVNPEGQLVTISHGDCEEDARWVGEQIKAELPMVDVEISYVGPVIGAHTGPGVVAVFCMGRNRQ
ncbi:MAG: DegV family protein [Clostridia bacterium]|nr:DegV family protein [Clostridia bacterium]